MNTYVRTHAHATRTGYEQARLYTRSHARVHTQARHTHWPCARIYVPYKHTHGTRSGCALMYSYTHVYTQTPSPHALVMCASVSIHARIHTHAMLIVSHISIHAHIHGQNQKNRQALRLRRTHRKCPKRPRSAFRNCCTAPIIIGLYSHLWTTLQCPL